MKRIGAIGMLVVAGLAAAADYPADREAAMKQLNGGDHAGALAAFLAMGEKAETDKQKADAFEQAALCARTLNRVDQALELAARIPLQPQAKACRLAILGAARRGADVIREFGGENLDAWPPSLAGNAFLARGRAFAQAKQGEKAEADLTRAAALLDEPNHKGLALNALGDVYRDLLKDDARALAVYRGDQKAKAINKRVYAAAAAARILARQGKYDEANTELDAIDSDAVTHPEWAAELVVARGDVLAAQGKKKAAADRYLQAREVKGLGESGKAAIDRKLKELE